jgi:hypothetical protein
MRGIYEVAVESVKGRGFHDNVLPIITEQPLFVQQYGRFVEELAEFTEALRTGTFDDERTELADCAVALAQLFHLAEIDPDEISAITSEKCLPIIYYTGELWRVMRKWRTVPNGPKAVGDIQSVLVLLAASVNHTARGLNIHLEEAVADKLAADERRGYLHSLATRIVP